MGECGGDGYGSGSRGWSLGFFCLQIRNVLQYVGINECKDEWRGMT